MNRFTSFLPRLLLALVLGLSASCVTTLSEGDRLYLAGDLAQAEAAYRAYLTSGRATGDAEARARYRLGLIYALPGSDLHDWQMANRALTLLIEGDPGSPWTRQARLLLALHDERERLALELHASDDRVSALLSEVVELKEAAEVAGDEAETREARMEQLAIEIAALQRSIGELQERVAAREKELERIKRIDLQTPP